mmetsp:Transcript_30230/g.41740  ORF Transcript_30230/g.41740 Transcript_30230/m.41740 type:complete len:125 (+) Transcript_30230:103-477(+)
MYYVQELNESIQVIQEKIQAIKNTTGGDRLIQVRECEKIIDDANEMLVTMSFAARSLATPSKREEMKRQTKRYRVRIEQLTNEMKIAELGPCQFSDSSPGVYCCLFPFTQPHYPQLRSLIFFKE